MNPTEDCAVPPTFIADAMLGRLATWLRILGYDTEYFRGDDAALLVRARSEGRIVLTRDRALVGRRQAPPHLFIESDHVAAQVRQVIAALCLRPGAPTRRCLRCNAILIARQKADVMGRVPEYVWSHHEAFWACPYCERIYWAGSHRRRMDDTVRAFWG
ncbi:MAG TPA: Mut7-C RNAse domain-containing protein [Candidatus Baltobacteraceae bacterium]|nr:Mut7-C RNAse domain-containing protein [Candidatus Baltobacteraceae bacterium]